MTFKSKVREFYKKYYENNDEAHKIEHADEVCNLALKLNKTEDEKLIILSSYIHDIFTTQRDIHHKLAYEYVLKAEDKFLSLLSKDELLLVAHAVLEHRASFKGEYYSELSKLISAADRGVPDIKRVVLRSMKFNNQNANNVYNHILNKYGNNGYAKYPEVYKKFFDKELLEFKKEADQITVDRVWEIWYEAKAS